MDNLDDSENNAKVSDSAYSNSCSNSQSRRSRSSKSTHSGSNSSGSSGYGGKPSSGLGQPPEKRSKDAKKKKVAHVETIVDEPQAEADNTTMEQPVKSERPKEDTIDVVQTSSPVHMQPEKGVDVIESTNDRNSNHDEILPCNTALVNASNNSITNPTPLSSDGFSCIITMHDGVVIYTTTSLTTALGFPKQMWIGRSFIDFVHPRDRNTFASQITNGLAVPKSIDGTHEKGVSVSTMVCRLRRYRGLSTGFGVTDRSLTYLPFLLKLSFRKVSEEEGMVIYLVIRATFFGSAYKTSNETMSHAMPFVIRHSANGNLEYIDPESVPYLGYLPQEIADKNVLMLYHPEDLTYLRQVYETIVKEGGMTSSEPYRLMVQNGDYVKVETEWSSFINPWSKKLEFVIGKHIIVEGPLNPDVFQTPNLENASNQNAEQKNKLKCFRDNMIRIMNEVLTGPAELAKQHMSKRCQDLANVMESLLEEPPKADEELRLEILEADHSCYIRDSVLSARQQVAKAMVFQERDSVMLGGISPHHEYSDSKASSDTPLSYNQLNYNENMQRYFGSHQPHLHEDYTVTGENMQNVKEQKTSQEICLSPLAQYSADSGELISSCESSGLACNSLTTSIAECEPARLTESMLNKHNIEMEKELVKLYRGNRSSCKGDAEKNLLTTMRCKQEHLARCNSAYQPTAVGIPHMEQQTQGLKRPFQQDDLDADGHRHHYKQRCKQSTSAAQALPLSCNATVGSRQWPPPPSGNMSTYLMGFGVPQEIPVMNSVTTVPGMIPIYYTSTSGLGMTRTPFYNMTVPIPSTNDIQLTPPSVQCMMYGQAMYGSPLMYSSASQIPYSQQKKLMAKSQQFPNSFDQYMSSNKSNMKQNQSGNGEAVATATAAPSSDNKAKGNSEDRTDGGESSYSSFYSSFFRTDSGSAEESGGDPKKHGQQNLNANSADASFEPHAKKREVMVRRKMDPPWMKQVCVTSELVYKYQVQPKSVEQVLTDDKKKMDHIEQPCLVNEQLGQLYLDLQLEGVASRLTLDEGITSSGSSVDESLPRSPSEILKRKREYSKLVLIYEGEMPLPLPEVPAAQLPATFTAAS